MWHSEDWENRHESKKKGYLPSFPGVEIIPEKGRWTNRRIRQGGNDEKEKKGRGERQGKTTEVKGDNILFTERVLNRNIALQAENFRSLDADGADGEHTERLRLRSEDVFQNSN